MSIKNARKLGFVMSLSMLIGSVVGIGIFFKSHSILKSNDWNGIGTLMSWIIGGVLSLGAAISFSEMGSFKTKRVHGLPGWAEKVGGKKFGYFVRFNYSFFYLGVLVAVLGYFGSEMIFNFIVTLSNEKISAIPFYAHVIVGLVISVGFLLLNYFSVRGSGWVQTISTILKWVPLLLVAFGGIIMATTNNAPGSDGKSFAGQNAFSNGQPFKFEKMLAALPAVLFAFDAFLIVGSVRAKMEKPNKLPAVVLFGMISVIVLYVLIAISAILHGSGMVSGSPFNAPPAAGLGIFDQIFTANVAEIMGKIVVGFLLISTFGVINGLSAGTIANFEQSIETNTLFGAKTLKKKIGTSKASLVYTLSIVFFWAIVIAIPALILNSDAIVDGISNFPTLFFFGIYGTIILLYTLKRKTFETKKLNKIFFNVFAWIAIIGIAFVVLYQLFYGFTIQSIMNSQEEMSWGLFVGELKMLRYQGTIIFLTFLLVFSSFPFLNKYLIKKFENEDSYIDTFENNSKKVI